MIICGGKTDITVEKHDVPIEYENGHMTFEKLDICYACRIALRDRANFAKLKYIKEKRGTNA